MAIRTDFTAGEVLAAADLNDTFAAKLNLAGGKVLKVVSATTTAAFSTTSLTYVDITDLTLSITPTSASNKVLVIASTNATATTGTNRAGLRLVRDSTAICVGAAAGSRTQASATHYSGDQFDIGSQTITFLDSPAVTTATTYKIQIIASAAGTIYNNRGQNDSDVSSVFRLASTITAMEISA
jgi:hypothetical protein